MVSLSTPISEYAVIINDLYLRSTAKSVLSREINDRVLNWGWSNLSTSRRLDCCEIKQGSRGSITISKNECTVNEEIFFARLSFHIQCDMLVQYLQFTLLFTYIPVLQYRWERADRFDPRKLEINHQTQNHDLHSFQSFSAFFLFYSSLS